MNYLGTGYIRISFPVTHIWVRLGGLSPLSSCPAWKSKALWKKVYQKILISRWSASDQRWTLPPKVVPSAKYHCISWFFIDPQEYLFVYYRISYSNGMQIADFPRLYRWDHFWGEGSSLIGRRSSTNQYFLINFFKSALYFHGGHDGVG